MPVVIRSASLNHVPAILAIERQAPDAAHWTVEQYKKLVGSGVVLVAEEATEEAGKLCGFVCAICAPPLFLMPRAEIRAQIQGGAL